MRIAQVSPLYERVPPRYYGGTERIVSYLTEELVEQGHEVTLFASGDSKTKARLVAGSELGLRLDPEAADYNPYHVLQLEQVMQEAEAFDIIHFHTDYPHFPLSRRLQTANVTTFHGRLDLPDLVPVFREFSDTPVISISNSQKEPLPWMNWQDTVYHGLPIDLYRQGNGDGGYLAFLGRICPEKRLDRAIEIAKRTNIRLKVASKVDVADQEYMDTNIRPLLDHPLIEFLGEIGHDEKQKLLGGASALLFPIDWCEPFGLVMIESMACGTPIIAYRAGSVPEVIDHGVTGFIVENIDESVEAVKNIQDLDRNRCRQVFEGRFSSARMAADYLKTYRKLIAIKNNVNLHGDNGNGSISSESSPRRLS
jgi:glycosyltransferase involved in cell wall biosynthesis